MPSTGCLQTAVVQSNRVRERSLVVIDELDLLSMVLPHHFAQFV
jgi:hypothetical protein